MDLLRRVEAELRRSGVTASRFGRDAVGDPRLVHDMRRGRRPGERLSAQVNAYMAALAANDIDAGEK
jgi:hypothetical protein